MKISELRSICEVAQAAHGDIDVILIEEPGEILYPEANTEFTAEVGSLNDLDDYIMITEPDVEPDTAYLLIHTY